MNKRIKELAGCAFDDLENDPVIIFKPEDLKEFAELIIRECIASIRALDNDAPYDEWTSGYTSAIISAAEAVEERFDIKE